MSGISIPSAGGGGSFATVTGVPPDNAALSAALLVKTVRAASSANVNLTSDISAGDTLDSVVLVSGDRVLLKNQTAPSSNGIYVVTAGTATRAADFDSWADVPGAIVTVQEGDSWVDTMWFSTSDGGGSIDSSLITFQQLPTQLPLMLFQGGTAATTAAGARTNLGVGTGDSPQFAAVNIGAAADTTLTRVSAGRIAVEGVSVGNLELPQNSQSAACTTVLADSGKHLFHPSADTAARTWTIDSNANVAYPVGTELTFVNQNGAGVITIAITSDTMRLAGAGTTGSRTLAANGIATALKVTATEWLINGTGLT